MTPEELDTLVRKGKPREVYEALVDVDDETRKKLGPTIKNILKAMRTADGKFSGRMTWEQRWEAEQYWDKKNQFAWTNTYLAVLAAGPAAEAHRVVIHYGTRKNYGRMMADILVNRNPAWLDTWVNKKLDGEFPQLSWAMVRRFYEAGLIDKPTSDGYVRMFVAEMNSWEWKKPHSYLPPSKRLLEQPDYLEEDIWRLFEVETYAFPGSFHEKHPEHPNTPDHYESWKAAVAKLVDEGHMDRERTLDASLAALDNEFKQNYLSGFARMHEFLKPTAEEMHARQQRYLDLLTHPAGPVVTFAIRMLGKLQRAKELDASRYFSSAAPVFAKKAKGSAIQALKIGAALLADDDTQRAAAAAFAIAAMSHPSPDVQEAALEFLADLMGNADNDLRSQFERQSLNLSQKLQARAAKILGIAPDAVLEPDVDIESVSGDIQSLSPKVRAIVGLEGDDFAGRMPAPVDFNLHRWPDLPGCEPFKRVESAEELLELAAHLVEIVDSADQIEALLDGIARFGPERSGNFEKLAAPIVQRLQSPGGTSSHGLGSYWSGLSLAMADLLLTWLTGRPHDTPNHDWYTESPVAAFPVMRLREVREIVHRRQPAQLLATPSLTGGWIEPGEFVERVRDHMTSKVTVYPGDFMQGLLRLSPVGRDKALRSAAVVPGEEGRLVRFALGDDDRPTKKDKRIAHVWVCAARARDPAGNLDEPLAAIVKSIPDLPNHLAPANYAWSIGVEEGHRSYTFYTLGFPELWLPPRDDPFKRKSITSRVANKLRRKINWRRWPLAAMHRDAREAWTSIYEMSSPWRIQWFSMVWPQNLNAYYQWGSSALAERIDQDTSRDAPVHAYLNPLFQAAQPWGELATLAFCLGLTSKSADARGFAIDAAIAGIESDHADAALVSKALGKMLGTDLLKLNRVSEALQQVLEASPLHRWWVAKVVTAVIAHVDKPPRNGHFLYDLLLESLGPLGLAVPDDAAALLRQLKGSSKAAKLAKQLLALEGGSLDNATEAIIAEAVAGRLRLAEAFD